MSNCLNKRYGLLVLLLLSCISTFVPALASNKSVLQSDDAYLQKILSIDDARHLLMRTGVGARAADIVALRGKSRQQAVDHIVEGISVEPEIPMPDWVNLPVPHYHARPNMEDKASERFNRQRDAELAQLRNWWVLNMLQTSSPQTERMVLFWHDVFATNYFALGKQSLAMARQNQTFRTLGFGSWERLIKAMIRDAALLQYLDSDSNHKASPNENLARELMELFVLGEGNYGEATVRDAARSLTGHDFSRLRDLQFVLKTGAQDKTDKLLFGQSGAFDGDDLVDILLMQDAAPRFLTKKFWQAFVSDSTPDAEWVADQSKKFRDSDFDITSLYRNVLKSEAFWHQDNRGAIIKSPVDVVTGTARTLDFPMSQWQRISHWQKMIGMDLFAPPNVAGWREGAAFITPGRLLNRYKVVRQLTHRAPKASGQDQSAVDMRSSELQDELPDINADSQNMLTASDSEQTGHVTIPVGSNSPGMFSSSSADISSRPVDNVLQHGRAALPDGDTVLRASAIHTYRGRANKKNGDRMLQIVLDNVQIPGKNFHNVGFTLEKKREQPLTLRLEPVLCWPDCLDSLPECSLAGSDLPTPKHLSLPWVTIGDDRWTATYDYQCQFDKLDNTQKQLVSTLWARLPDLLAAVKLTRRVKNDPDRWMHIINDLQIQYRDASISLADTVYAQSALQLDLSVEHAPSEPALQMLSTPAVSVDNIGSLIAELSAEDLLVHQLLLPQITGDQVPDPPVSDAQRPARYLRAILENPLFQLK